VEKNSNWFFRGCSRECSRYIVTPELHAEGSYAGIGDKVWYSGELDVESAN
jgi:hypothetical protein